MNYKEAIKHIESTDHTAQLLATTYNESDDHFYIYTISDDEDQDDLYIMCQVAGGILFDLGGIDDFLTIEEATPEISNLNFKVLDQSLDIGGLLTEHVLFKLFPELPNPENLFTEPEQQRFFKSAKKCVLDGLK